MSLQMKLQRLKRKPNGSQGDCQIWGSDPS
jgi:hypothetical protein